MIDVEPVAKLLGEQNEGDEVFGLISEVFELAEVLENEPFLQTLTEIVLGELVRELREQIGVVLLAVLLVLDAGVEVFRVEGELRPAMLIDHFPVADDEEHYLFVELSIDEPEDENEEEGEDGVGIEVFLVVDFKDDDVHVVEELGSIVVDELLPDLFEVD